MKNIVITLHDVPDDKVQDWIDDIISDVTCTDNAPKVTHKIDEVVEVFEKCPECGDMSVRAKGFNEGGGVECINKICGYWFCY